MAVKLDGSSIYDKPTHYALICVCLNKNLKQETARQIAIRFCTSCFLTICVVI